MLKGLKEKTKIMDLTKGNIISTLIRFSMPMIFGNLFQRFYNIADTMIVGRFINSGALAAVGSSYSFITFINSIFIGLCMGSSIYFSNCFGAYEREKFKKAIYHAFILIGIIAIVLQISCLLLKDKILNCMNITETIYDATGTYIGVIFTGMFFVFIYNFLVRFCDQLVIQQHHL